MRSWHDAKVFIEHATTISHDALHILAGTSAWLAFAMLFRRSLASWTPLIATIALILFNEAVDLWVEIWPQAAMQLGESAKDIATTIAVPTLIIVALHAVPTLMRPRPRGRGR